MEVGVRELKAKLSAHLERVKAGQTVVVTDRGKPVAKLVPIDARAVPSSVQHLLDTGAATWSGKRLGPFEPLPMQPGGPSIAEMISEDRR